MLCRLWYLKATDRSRSRHGQRPAACKSMVAAPVVVEATVAISFQKQNLPQQAAVHRISAFRRSMPRCTELPSVCGLPTHPPGQATHSNKGGPAIGKVRREQTHGAAIVFLCFRLSRLMMELKAPMVRMAFRTSHIALPCNG